MEHWKLENWCYEAVEKIKYRPDRDAVYAELLQHLDDRCESFIAQGMTKDEAVKKTVEVMGDAKGLAVQLAAIHRPFWGFAYSISKWLLIIIAVIMVVQLIGSIVNFAKAPPIIIDDWVTASDMEYNPITNVKPESTDTSDGYTFTVKEAQITELVYTYQDGTQKSLTYLYVLVNISTSNPFALPCYGGDAFWGTDNRGQYYKESDIRYHTATTVLPFSNDCLFKIPLDSWDDLTWFELRYDQAGRDIVLHIDLAGGVQG